MQISELPTVKYFPRCCTNVNGELIQIICCKYYIYSLINAENGKRYIGRTINPRSRINTHLALLKSGKHRNSLLNKDSGQKFNFEILSDSIIDANEAKRMERFYMLKYKTYDSELGYNGNDRMMQKYKESK